MFRKNTIHFLILISLILYTCIAIKEVRPGWLSAYVMDKNTLDLVKDSTTIKYKDAMIHLAFLELTPTGLKRKLYTTTTFFVGRISKINVIAKYIQGNNIIKDTINDKLTFKIEYDSKVKDKYKNLQDVEGKVSDIPIIRPFTSNFIKLYFTSPPDTTKLQYFVVEYIESDGLKLVDSTQKVYIK